MRGTPSLSFWKERRLGRSSHRLSTQVVRQALLDLFQNLPATTMGVLLDETRGEVPVFLLSFSAILPRRLIVFANHRALG